jgi:uncharacterized protein
MTRTLARPLFSTLLFLSALAVLLLDPAAAMAISVEQIPSPRPAGWTVDLTGTLPAATVADLNRLGDEVKAQTGGELAVVVVGSIDGAQPRDFATRLFNHWGIGNPQRNDGILVFAALDDRAAEIILGSGVDGPDSVQVKESIMQEQMVPRFRKGDPSGAIYQGALSAAQRILGATPTAAQSTPAAPPAPAPIAYGPSDPLTGQDSGQTDGVDTGEAVGIGAILALIASFIGPQILRRRTRRCPKCNAKMIRLDEAADDAHLNEQERTEERIGSLDYDLWACEPCGEVTKLQYSRFFSGYSQCPQCGAKTRNKTSSTLVAATYTHGGTVQVDEHCAHCSYHSTSTYNTPQRQRSSSTGSRLSSSGSRGSGGGFGGGRSSGRGASGRW